LHRTKTERHSRNSDERTKRNEDQEQKKGDRQTRRVEVTKRGTVWEAENQARDSGALRMMI